MTVQATLPDQLRSGLLQLGALAALLSCVDVERWNSLGRPRPDGLAALIFRAHADVEQGLENLEAPPAA